MRPGLEIHTGIFSKISLKTSLILHENKRLLLEAERNENNLNMPIAKAENKDDEIIAVMKSVRSLLLERQGE